MAVDLQQLKKLIRANAGLKLLALLLAALTFHVIRGVTGYEVEYEVPLQVVAEPGIAVLNQAPMAVSVRFRGTQEDLLRLNQAKLRAVVHPKASNPDGSEQRIRITAQDIREAPRVSVVMIDPPEARLTFDREIEATFPVGKPGLIGAPSIGKAELEYEPRIVRIRGPKRRLEELQRQGHNELTTEPVDVEGRVKTFTRQVRIIPPGDTWLSHIEPAEVTVKANIVTKVATRSWDKVTVTVLARPGVPFTIGVDPASAAVSLEGRAELLEKLGDDSLRVFVDCTALGGPGTYELPLNLHCILPEEIKPALTPATVKVTVANQR